MSALLEAVGITKVYGKETKTEVLKGIDLSIKKGEFVAIMGKSGSGKSTLLHMLSGMDRLTQGQVLFAGEDLADLSDEAISMVRLLKMGFVFQQSHLLKIMTIKENVMLPALKAKQKAKATISSETEDRLKQLGIDGVKDHAITEVSGGQLQRAAICRALINNPSIIFADEPTGALNSEASQEIMDSLNTINQTQTTLVLVTHDSKVAARADRVLYLNDGVIESEYHMEKYPLDGQTLKRREQDLMTWLSVRGF